MSKTPSLLLALAAGCAFFPQIAISATAGTAPWVKMGALPGSDAGRIAFDPNSPNTMLVGPGSGGGKLFHSTNGGTSFTSVQVGGLYECFRAIAFDPKKGSNTAFAFSSDNFNNGANGGVYESINGGTSWTRLKSQPMPAGSTGTVGRGRGILIDSTGEQVVLADATFGFFYSANLGKTWSNPLPVAAAHGYALAADPKSATTIWAGGRDVGTNNAVLWTSANFGKSWTEVQVPALNQNAYPTPLAIAVLPNSNTVLFSWTGYDENSNPIGGVIVSKDGGKSWADSSKGLPANFNPGNAIVVDPTTPSTIYLTTNGLEYPNGLYRSTDSGATWTSLGASIGGGDSIYTAAARPAAAGVTAAVFAANQDLMSSTNHGASWTVSANGTSSGIVRTVQDDLLATGGIYAGGYNGLFHSANNGQTWTRISASWTKATVPNAFAVDPVAKTHTVYAVTSTGFWQSANAGKTWTSYALPAKATEIQQLVADTSVAGRVYAIDSTRFVYRSDNGGKTWAAGVGISANTTDSFFTNPQVIADPTQAGTLFAGMGSGIWKSANSDKSWSLTKSVANLASIAATKQKTGTEIFVVAGSGSSDNFSYGVQAGLGGTSLKNAANPYPNNGGYPFSLAAASNGQLFAFGEDNTLMRSTDSAATWKIVNGPIESSITTSDQASVTTGNVYVSDFSSDSAYVAPLSALTTSAPATSQPMKRSAIRSGQAARHIAE